MHPSVRTWSLFIALLLPLIGGCTTGEVKGSVVVTPPQIGDVYTYRSANGQEHLEVRVEGLAPRLDAFQRVRDSIHLNLTLDDGEGGEPPWRFEEAVDPPSGRLLQQVGLCGKPNGENGERTCWDERALVVFAVDGLPGALGAGPFWGEALEPSTPKTLHADRIQGPDLNLTFTVTATPGQDGRCVDLQAPPVDASYVRALPLTVLSGPITLCDGLSLPYAFQTFTSGSFESKTFVLTKHTQGQQALETDPEQGPTYLPAEPVPGRKWQAPLVAADPSDPAPFTVREAHEAAMDLSDGYRAFLEDHPSALVLSSSYGTSGTAEVLQTYQQRSHRRTLLATTPEGPAYFVRVNQQTRGVDNSPNFPGSPSYSIEDEGARSVGPGPERGQISPQLARLGPAFNMSDCLRGHPGEDYFNWGMHITLTGNSWNYELSGGPVLTDGYLLVLHQRDPSPGTVQGAEVHVGYQSVIHGPTGSFLWIHVPRGELPLEQPCPPSSPT